MSNETIYWGILCRQCSELVAFCAPSHQQFELASRCAKPGAIRCANGHNYIYFPRDFRFFTSAVAIPEAVMQRNLEAHSAINSIVGARTNHGEPERWRPEEVEDSFRFLGKPEVAKSVSASYGADPQTETAHTVVTNWWQNWATKKAS